VVAPLGASAAVARTAAVPTAVASAEPSGAPDVWDFGRGPKSLGRGTSPDGHPVAPASFLADESGVVVLDQENARIVRSDGRSIPLPGARADDLARGADGSLAVLDRLGSKEVAILDPEGRVRGRLPLEGPGVESAREVSRVVVSGKDVYVEVNGGGPLVRIGSTDGKPADVRGEVAGIPTRDGTALLSAGITSEREGRAWVTVADEQGAHRWTRELRFPGELSAVGFLDSGGHGAVWAVLLAGSTRADYTNWAVCLDVATGRVRTSATLAVESPAWESFRDFAVREDGSLVVARRSEQQVTYAAYPCGGAD
jgi:hypothetical protein